MTRTSATGTGGNRAWDGAVLWLVLASFGILIALLALGRSLEQRGAGGRWRRAYATGEEVDALLAAEGRRGAG